MIYNIVHGLCGYYSFSTSEETHVCYFTHLKDYFRKKLVLPRMMCKSKKLDQIETSLNDRKNLPNICQLHGDKQ